MPLGRPLLRRLRLPFRHECYRWCATADRTRFPLTKAVPCHWTIAASWCWLEDSNLPPLAYEASALPDELSQLGNRQKDRGAAPGVEATLSVRRGSAPRPNLDVHNVKERGATGAVVTGVRAHGPRTRARMRVRRRHMR